MAKMTRKEAVELLKNRKVYVRNPKESEAVQKKLFECGFRWADGVSYIQHTNKPYLFIWDDMEIAQSSIEYVFNFSNQTEISANEILSTEIVEEYVPKFGDIVRVNCYVSGFKRNYMICIMPDKIMPTKGDFDNEFFNIANITMDGDLKLDCEHPSDCNIIPASESEKQELFDKLAKAGKRWNAERKCLEDISNSLGFIKVVSKGWKTINHIKGLEDIQQELNLCEILKDCPMGTKFYTTIHGKVRFKGIRASSSLPIMIETESGYEISLTKKGKYTDKYDGECIIFPSKDQRDWSKWVCPKPDLPIDTPVMVQNTGTDWRFRYYAGNKNCWDNTHKSTDGVGFVAWRHIIPFDKFNPNNIEESLKYDICKK